MLRSRHGRAWQAWWGLPRRLGAALFPTGCAVLSLQDSGAQGLGRGSGREVVVQEEMACGPPHGAGPRSGPERAPDLSDGASLAMCLCCDPPGSDESCVGDPVWATSHISSTLPSPQDAASFRAEPEPVYSMEAAGYQEASSQQGPAYASDAVYEATEAPGHYQTGTGTGAPHQALCFRSSAKGVPVSPLPGPQAGSSSPWVGGRQTPSPGLSRGSHGGSRKAATGWWVGGV